MHGIIAEIACNNRRAPARRRRTLREQARRGAPAATRDVQRVRPELLKLHRKLQEVTGLCILRSGGGGVRAWHATCTHARREVTRSYWTIEVRGAPGTRRIHTRREVTRSYWTIEGRGAPGTRRIHTRREVTRSYWTIEVRGAPGTRRAHIRDEKLQEVTGL